MSNEYNNDWEYTQDWERETYRTGATEPPKRRGGLIAALLVVIIALCGIITVLGLVNIRLFRQVNTAELAGTLPFSFSNQVQDPTLDTAPADAEATAETQGKDAIAFAPSVESPENLPQEGGKSLQEIYASVIDSVVSISCSYRGGSSTGTGVILSKDGYIVTNYHVVENAQSVQVLLTDGRTLEASLVGGDEASDLAVLRISADGLTAASLGDSSALRVGDAVVAIGDPLGMELRGTMTDGIISAINRDIYIDGRTMSLIQTNAALNSGNSGGPLINAYGQVIGINTMKMGDSMSVAGVEGLGFAIPSATVKEVANQLINQGYVSGRPSLGITCEEVQDLHHFYYRIPKGLYITAVTKGGSAHTVGIQEGDILVSINDRDISSVEALKSLLYNYAPGDTLEAVIYRSGKYYSVKLTVGEAK